MPISLGDESDGFTKKFIHAKSQHLTEEENLIIKNKVLRGQCIEGTTQIIKYKYIIMK